MSNGAGKTWGARPARKAASSRSTVAVSRSGSEASKRQLEKAALAARRQRYVLRLYVTGMTAASSRAIEQVRSICEEHLRGRYELEVIDIHQKPALAKDEQIVAAPTLIKVLPAPLRRFIGDLSKVEKILFGLDLREKR
jgi:circadian clock protein KaiB